MDSTERTIQILEEMRDGIKDIRDEARQTNARLDRVEYEARETNARLDQTNAQLDQTNARLDRQSNAIAGLESAVVHGLAETNAHLEQQSNAIAGLESAVVHELGATNALLERQSIAISSLDGAVRDLGSRMDNVLIGEMGKTVRDHEARIRDLERGSSSR